jgi:glyoxylase-like metal-dependent hydrolase (beta-lactamase superfamily II)
MQSIADGIFYNNNYPGVTLGAVIMPRGTLMIDAPLRLEDARTWKSVLLAQSRGTYRLLANLDAHIDRTLGARHLDCTIIAQKNVLSTFENRSAVFKGHPVGSAAEWENYPEVSGTRWSIPNLTFSNHMNLHWGDNEIILEHHPGPTIGSSWVIIPAEKVVFIGDAIGLDQPPFLDMADLPSWINSVSELRSPRYRDYTIISGRGGPISIEYVREQHDQLKNLYKRLETLSQKGAAPEDTASLIKPFLSKLDYSPALQDTYEQRLRYGLERYYRRKYLPEEIDNGN